MLEPKVVIDECVLMSGAYVDIIDMRELPLEDRAVVAELIVDDEDGEGIEAAIQTGIVAGIVAGNGGAVAENSIVEALACLGVRVVAPDRN